MKSGQKSVRDADQAVAVEVRRTPSRVLSRYRRLDLLQDFHQELYLGYYLAPPDPAAVRRAVHAAAERFRYRELTRAARRNVPLEFAPRSCHMLLHGESGDESPDSQSRAA